MHSENAKATADNCSQPYRLLLLDIDGTLRPPEQRIIPEENVREIQRVRSLGIKTAIATGRGRNSVPDKMLNGLEPDYWICAAGAQILSGDGTELYADRMPLSCMETLIRFADLRDIPLGFSFDDGLYIYRDYGFVQARNQKYGIPTTDRNCPDRDRHLRSMPFSAVAFPKEEDISLFQTRYADLGLCFAFFNFQSDDGRLGCDLLRPGQDKANAMAFLNRYLHIPAEATVAAGDGINDIRMLRAAGLGYAMSHALPEVKKAADRVSPKGELAVARLCREVWP